MTRELGQDALEAGRQFGENVADILMDHVNQCGSDEERLLWWTGLFAYLGGMASGHLGDEGADAMLSHVLICCAEARCGRLN